MRSDRDDEYYGKFNETDHHLGSFARFLQENGIIAQYTISDTPQQNGIAEKYHQTLLDMAKCMMARCVISDSFSIEFLWGDAIKTIVYTLNQVPTKKNYNFNPF